MERWVLRQRKFDLKEMSKKYGISETICKIIRNRDICDEEMIESYLNPGLNYLHNPRDMKDIEKAASILEKKIKENKKIRIVGDYDVDGVISVFILFKAFNRLGAKIDYEIPDRINDGYGINKRIIEDAKKDGIDTIVTCDNGISAIEPIKLAKELGLTVIVTDHHDIPFIEGDNGERTYISSEADAIINHKQEECKYKFKKICGAAVAYKLIEVLYENMRIPKEECYKFIEYVSIATVCDVVDLIDENRVFVRYGLELLNNTENIGLQQLKKAASLEDKKLTAYHLGFVIGPCLNAAGRLESAKKGLSLLLEEDVDKASELAKEIVDINNERKDMTADGVEEAVKIIEEKNMEKDKVLVIYIPEVHESLAGIIAGRIKERYNKPTIVLTKAYDGVKGSARSIEEYNMFEGLIECKDLLTKFGGHPMAAGLSLLEENIDKLREELNNKCTLTDEELLRKVVIDVPLSIDKIDFDFINDLDMLEPFGKGNSKPVFAVKNVKITRAMILGKENNVLKLKLDSGRYKSIDAIYFNGVEDFEEKVCNKYGEFELDKLYKVGTNNIYMDLIYYPSINEWNGNKTVQIIISSVR